MSHAASKHRAGARAAAGAIALALAASICGCAGGSSRPVAVTVGDASIDRASVDHWARAIGTGAAVATSLGRLHGTPREKALEFLISGEWLTGQAAKQGLEVSDRTLARALRERIESLPNGQSEFRAKLSASRQTVDDVKLELKTTLAGAMLREALSRRFPPLTHADVAAYYNKNRSSLRYPDEIVVDLIENIPTRAEARALGRRLGPGTRFTEHAMRELVLRQAPYKAPASTSSSLVRAIYAAVPGKLTGPVPFKGYWVILVVRRTVPGLPRPLADVAEEIAKRLLAQRRASVERGFLERYRRTWRARTDCRPGFAVQKCAQYRGTTVAEEDPLRATERGP